MQSYPKFTAPRLHWFAIAVTKEGFDNSQDCELYFEVKVKAVDEGAAMRKLRNELKSVHLKVLE